MHFLFCAFHNESSDRVLHVACWNAMGNSNSKPSISINSINAFINRTHNFHLKYGNKCNNSFVKRSLPKIFYFNCFSANAVYETIFFNNWKIFSCNQTIKINKVVQTNEIAKHSNHGEAIVDEYLRIYSCCRTAYGMWYAKWMVQMRMNETKNEPLKN